MSAEYVRVLGNVVEKWEPFFSEGFDFEDVANSPTGQSVQMHYDARGRTVRTVRPDGGQNRVIFGVPGSIDSPDITTPGSFEPTPWERYTYDASDNAGRTPVEAPTDHHDTPTSVVFDAKGRTIKTVERNGHSSSDELVTQTDYDIRGNVTNVIDPEGRDAAVQVFDLADVGVSGTDHLQRVFEYDPIYRLTKATGREYSATKTYPWDDNGGNSDDPTQTHGYTELYEYDDVGNMTKLTHQYDNNTGTWTRNFSHETASNQLDTMNDGCGLTRNYSFDAAGNLTKENSNRKHEWDWGGRMRSFRDQPPGSQATRFAHYTYNSGGQPVQKVVNKSSGDPIHTVYIGGLFEHHEKISSGSVSDETHWCISMEWRVNGRSGAEGGTHLEINSHSGNFTV